MEESGKEGAAAEDVLETTETAKASKSMRGLGAVGEEWMGRWLRQWEF